MNSGLGLKILIRIIFESFFHNIQSINIKVTISLIIFSLNNLIKYGRDSNYTVIFIKLPLPNYNSTLFIIYSSLFL